MVTPTQVSGYYAEYVAVRNKVSVSSLHDIYGFIVSDTKPATLTHPYYKFTRLEDDHMYILKPLVTEWGHGVPCIKNLLAADLKIENAINKKFMEYLAAANEE